MSDGYIHIVGWDKFQHGSRENPWIKDYVAQLHKDEYLELSAHLRGILHDLRLIYAASHRQVRDNTATLKRQLGYRVVRRDIERLCAAGFIEVVASTVLAQSRVEEKDREGKPSLSPPPAPKVPKPRARDPIWDTLVELIGASPAGLERGKWNAAVKSLKDSGATPDTLRLAVATYRSHPTYADCAMTVTALASNWTTLTANTNGNGHAAESPEAFRARIAAIDAQWRAP